HADTMQISRGKLDRLHRAPAESTAPALVERTLRIRARSSGQDCLIFGFCPSGRGFASALLSDGSSRQPPLRLASPLSHQTWAEDFHLQAVKHARHTRTRGKLPERVSCVQRRLARSAGGSPARATARRPVAWIAGRRAIKDLKPIDNPIERMGASHRAAAEANAGVASKFAAPKAQ